MDSFQNLDGNLTSSSSSSQQGHGDGYQELLSFPGSAVPPNGQGGIEVAGTQEWTRDGSSRTLWMGDLDRRVDAKFIQVAFLVTMNANVHVKIPGTETFVGTTGYCFVQFETKEAARKALELNGLRIPNSDRNFVLNWASRDNDADSYSREGPVYSLYVGNLGPDVDGPMLEDSALFALENDKISRRHW
ncbi:putative rna-binding post-transcriptional regulator csx1 protein [Eutypa lata UCREL1]|uniref:Putative rna-binding post-transcriptional regulator csx1 protein n=1 Tax=Eutypa lata (strain UCR-EL1) TaxID=1287681 RepID=M7T315_EUTLA|nr:putative rna-binding post-transcriptional regulator csx1 protein [Eutypa lata UCREL1]